MKKVQQGFTLIELMIVVAIIGILAAIAIPQYQDYVTRARWSDNFASVGSFKTAIAECLQNNSGTLTACDTVAKLRDNGFWQSTDAPAAGAGTVTLVEGSAAIRIAGTTAAGSCTVTMAPDVSGGNIRWNPQTTGNNCNRSKVGVGT